MLVWGVTFNWINDDSLSALSGCLWIGAWMIMGPLKKWITIKRTDPKLDAKYPLTVNRIDKDKESR